MLLSKQRREIDRVMRRFLYAWQHEDWEGMYRSCQLTWASKASTSPEGLQAMFEHRPLVHYELVHIGQPKAHMVDVELRLDIESDNRFQTFTARARLAQEIKPYVPGKGGKWGVNPVSVTRMQPVEGE